VPSSRPRRAPRRGGSADRARRADPGGRVRATVDTTQQDLHLTSIHRLVDRSRSGPGKPRIRSGRGRSRAGGAVSPGVPA
jgi:hypothetical protein